jgi:hypothetical protein
MRASVNCNNSLAGQDDADEAEQGHGDQGHGDEVEASLGHGDHGYGDADEHESIKDDEEFNDDNDIFGDDEEDAHKSTRLFVGALWLVHICIFHVHDCYACKQYTTNSAMASHTETIHWNNSETTLPYEHV